jgi:hypothetical protein
MQLRTARLCLDCDEVHDAPQCPVCASGSFAFISRWVPSPERRERSRPPQPARDAEVYQQLLSGEPARPKAMRFLTRSAVGLVAFGLARWLWRQGNQQKQ